MIFVFYLAIIGPGFYSDIRCPATSGAEAGGRLDCSCWLETSSGKGLYKCEADELSPLPLIRLVEEERGAPWPLR